MKPAECPFEMEVLEAVLQARWPRQVDKQIADHVASCEICSDVIAVAGALDGAKEATRATAAVPDSGRVWWLAQVRARREAVRAAGRPITAAQVFGLACAVGVAGACFGATSKWFQSWLAWAGSAAEDWKRPSLFPAAVDLVAAHSVWIAAMAAIVLLVPAAVYWAVLKE